MIIYPAIDIKNKKCVRLTQGQFDKEEIFYDEPIVPAANFKSEGAQFLHIVDLDGAINGTPCNTNIIKDIIDELKIKVQVGGGIRSISAIEKMIEAGVYRVIIGTSALNNKNFVLEAIKKYGDKIAVSIDARNGFAVTHAWTEVTNVKVLELAKELEHEGLKTLIYTDISKDGMMLGPDFDYLKNLTNNTGLNIIASGGVCKINDIKLLRQMNCYGAIIGKALYKGELKLKEIWR